MNGEEWLKRLRGLCPFPHWQQKLAREGNWERYFQCRLSVLGSHTGFRGIMPAEGLRVGWQHWGLLSPTGLLGVAGIDTKDGSFQAAKS